MVQSKSVRSGADDTHDFYSPHAGTLFRGSRTDLVLFSGPDGVARIDIDGREPQRVELTPDLALVCGEA